MSIKVRVAATAIVAACAVGFATSASAFVYCHPKAPPPKAPGIGKTGGIVVGCIMGSAAGLIFASVVKGGGIKWMTQKEWEDLKVKVPNPLTTEEAMLIASTCGLYAFAIRPAKSAPAVVRAGG
jgi:hypothetical protein